MRVLYKVAIQEKQCYTENSASHSDEVRSFPFPRTDHILKAPARSSELGNVHIHDSLKPSDLEADGDDDGTCKFGRAVERTLEHDSH